MIKASALRASETVSRTNPDLSASPRAERPDRFGGSRPAGAPAPRPVVVAPAPVDPPFLPAGFDMSQAVTAMRALLLAQNKSLTPEMLQPGYAAHTWATDFDGTLGRTANVPVFLRAKADVIVDGTVVMKAGDYFKDPAGNDLMLHGLTGRDVTQDLADLKAAYPNLPWASVQQDWSAFDNRAVAMKTRIETPAVRRLKEASRAKEVTASFIITSRTNDDVAGGMHEALKARNTDVWGVILTGSASVQAALGVADSKITDGQRKAIVQMILLEMLAPKSHSWRDDSPSNTGRTIDSLAAKYPTIDLEVFDVSHVVGKNHSIEKLIARSNGKGQFIDPKTGVVWTPEKTAAHDNQSMPQLPRLTPKSVAQG